MNMSAMQIRGDATQPIELASQLLPEETMARPVPVRLVASGGQSTSSPSVSVPTTASVGASTSGSASTPTAAPTGASSSTPPSASTGAQPGSVQRARVQPEPMIDDPDATAIRIPSPKQLIGARVGTYLIQERLGAGGAAEVFKGIDLMLKREVAIKVLRPENASDPSFPERFRREAQILARLSHPNIASVHAFLQEGETQFMVMEYVPGISLDTLIRTSGPVSPERAVSIVRAALEGIGHAHACGIVHRDVKPANIMLTATGQVKVVDFGIARASGFDQHLTYFGQVPGTAKYMSPEQVRGEEVDARSDIYSLGVVLYMLLSGRAPFDGKSVYDLMKSQVEQTPPPLQKLVAGVPAQLEAAVRRALAKHPADRFQSIGAFAGILDACLAEIRRPASAMRADAVANPPLLARPASAAPARQPVMPRVTRQVRALTGSLWSRLGALRMRQWAPQAGTKWPHGLGYCAGAFNRIGLQCRAVLQRARHIDRRVLAGLFAAPLVAGGLLGALVLHPVFKQDESAQIPQPRVEVQAPQGTAPQEIAPQAAPVVIKPSIAITRLGVNSDKGHVFAPGERIALRIALNQDAYMYCYLQDENARIVRFFPNRFHKGALVKADAPVQIPGAMPFELVANSLRVRETVACFATERDLSAQLPESVVGTDFDNLPVASLDQLAGSFAAAAGPALAQASFPVLFD